MHLAPDKVIFDAMLTKLQGELPSITIAYKDESKWMRFLGVLVWLFNRKFMSDYTTTVGYTVYFPSRSHVEADYQRAWRTLSHESVHIRQWLSHPKTYKLSYMAPQALALGALLAFGAFIWHPMVWCLLALAFAAPLPSPGRVHWEEGAYLMSICCDIMIQNESLLTQDNYLTYYADHYTTGAYYWMSWRRGAIESSLRADFATAKALVDGTKTLEPYSSMIDFVKGVK